MPIMDYKGRAELSKKALFDKETISAKNKQYIKDFLLAYEKNVKPARIHILCTHILKFLEMTNDVKKDMVDRKVINEIFTKLKEKESLINYSMIMSVSKVFVRWLNDGDTPLGFKDIKMPKKKSLKRDLSKEDMISWEDGIKMISNSKVSVQFKAILMMQLDGGFRPSEFVDLNFGDCEVKGDIVLVHVKDGKTGERDVPLYKSVPYLINWLNIHPAKIEKDKKDPNKYPLWVMEYQKNSRANVKDGVIRYEYPAIRKRIIRMGIDAKIKKPLDFYNLRHSACRLAKLDNIPLDVASEKFGHSPDFFLNTYGRLDAEDKIKKFKQHLGMEEESKKKANRNIICEICGKVNSPQTEICGQCARPLTIEKALERSQELERIQKQMSELLKRLELIELYRRKKKD